MRARVHVCLVFVFVGLLLNNISHTRARACAHRTATAMTTTARASKPAFTVPRQGALSVDSPVYSPAHRMLTFDRSTPNTSFGLSTSYPEVTECAPVVFSSQSIHHRQIPPSSLPLPLPPFSTHARARAQVLSSPNLRVRGDGERQRSRVLFPLAALSQKTRSKIGRSISDRETLKQTYGIFPEKVSKDGRRWGWVGMCGEAEREGGGGGRGGIEEMTITRLF